MRALLLSLSLAASIAAVEPDIELLVPLASAHKNLHSGKVDDDGISEREIDGKYQINPGIGLNLSLNEPLTPVLIGAYYRNSLGQPTLLAGAGIRVSPCEYLDATLALVYLKNEWTDGLQALPLPAIGIGTDRCKVQIHIAGFNALGASLRIRL